MCPATDRDQGLVHVPLVAGSGTVLTDTLREVLTNAVGPQSDGLAADKDSLARLQVFTIRRAHGEAIVSPDHLGDDFTRITQAGQAWHIKLSFLIEPDMRTPGFLTLNRRWP